MNFRFDPFSPQPTRGDATIFELLKEHFGETTRLENTNRILEAGHRLVSSSENAISIDNAIDTLEDEDVAFIGKVAISRIILLAERALNRSLIDRETGSALQLGRLSNTWVATFMRLLTADVRRSQLSSIFKNISIINFNYDRVLEYIIPPLLSVHYNVPTTEAEEMFSQLSVLHPYGRLSSLRSPMPRRQGASFGDTRYDAIIDGASSLRTFTQQIDDRDVLNSIAHELNSAARMVFLGFGYHRQNIELLERREGLDGEILGTTFQVPSPEVASIRNDIVRTMRCSAPTLIDRTCRQFLDEFGRAITA